MGRTTLTVDDSTFEKLQNKKREGESWNMFLERLASEHNSCSGQEVDYGRIREIVNEDVGDAIAEAQNNHH